MTDENRTSEKFKRLDLKRMLANKSLKRNVPKELLINDVPFNIIYDSKTDILTIIDNKDNKIILARDNHYFYIKNGLLVVGNDLRILKIDRKAFYCIRTYLSTDENGRNRLLNDDFYMSVWKWLYPNLFLANTNNLKVFLLEKKKYDLGETIRIVEGEEVMFESFDSKDLDTLDVKKFILDMGLCKYKNSTSGIYGGLVLYNKLDAFLTHINQYNKDL